MHPSSPRTPAVLLAALAVLGLAFTGPPARAESADAPGLGVARLSVVRGPVAVRRGDSATPVDAVLNAPVLGGDYVTTGDGGRAEIQLDRAAAVRLDQDVQLRFTRLDGAERRLQLAQGTVDLRVLRGSGNAALDTPSVSLRPRAPGSYRVSVDADGATELTVRSGAADVLTPQGTRALLPGTTLTASGSADAPALSSGAALASDDFDRFNGERDERETRALANAYVASDVEGVDDLSDYGRWVSDGSYGNVWVPSAVAPGWAPYRYGRWVWEDYYGWTWIGAEPWGWAPYHYGNWYRSAAYGWCWYPGQPHAVALWRPALVAFFTFGGGGWGFGDVGWVPLAPFEPYRPWWGANYYTITNVTNVTNNYYGPVGNGAGELARYANARHGGATAIGAQRFTEGRFEHPRALGGAQLAHAAVVRGPLPLVPSEANLRFKLADTAGARPLPRRALVERGFAGRALPVARIPFEQQRSAIANVTHLRAAPLTNAAPPTHAAPLMKAVPVTNAVPENDPWSRFDRARGTTAGAATAHPLRAVPGGGSRASGPSTQSTRVYDTPAAGRAPVPAVPRRVDRAPEARVPQARAPEARPHAPVIRTTHAVPRPPN